MLEIFYLPLSTGTGSECKQHILPPVEVRKFCYSLAEL